MANEIDGLPLQIFRATFMNLSGFSYFTFDAYTNLHGFGLKVYYNLCTYVNCYITLCV